ncbi:hypothetical protein [Streptomyces sp. NPDC096324]
MRETALGATFERGTGITLESALPPGPATITRYPVATAVRMAVVAQH